MTSVLVRIALRYAAGALVAKGLLSPDDGSMLAVDAELAQAIEVGVGLAIGAGTEWAYYLARKLGWSK